MRKLKKPKVVKPKAKSKRKTRGKPALKKPVDPILLRARSLRSSLLRRIDPSLKHTTPTIEELFNWLNRDHYICFYSLEELSLKDKERYQQNKDEYKEKSKAYYQKNKDKINEKRRVKKSEHDSKNAGDI